MTYAPQGPFSTGGTATAANLTAMDNGISANDTAISGTQTPSESATPAASGSVATLLSFIVSQLKLITGGAHWYSAPAATLASLLSSVNSNTSAINGKVSNDGGAIFTNGSGTLSAAAYGGPFNADIESAQTVIRVPSTVANYVIQVNGHNWVFRNDGKLITPSGAVIS